MTVGVFHLVRKVNGPEPYAAFLRSLRAAPPTGDWRLVLICKGFVEGEADEYLRDAADLPVRAVYITDEGLDIAAYFKAAQQTAYDPLIFFNSFSAIVEPRWFTLFSAVFGQPGVGLVGATGSLESVVRNHRIYASEAKSVAAKAKNLAIAAGLVPLFPGFPNPHVRTNAFMVGRADFLATKRYAIDRKLGSWVFESGWLSLTRQIQKLGKKTLIVTRDSVGLAPDRWADAAAFRSGAQDKVLVEDNRVREYRDATPERRQMLRWLAFGQRDGS